MRSRTSLHRRFGLASACIVFLMPVSVASSAIRFATTYQDLPSVTATASVRSVDIDRDGKLDFLVNTSTHYNVRETTLFLSHPDPEKLVPVALTHTTGC